MLHVVVIDLPPTSLSRLMPERCEILDDVLPHIGVIEVIHSMLVRY